MRLAVGEREWGLFPEIGVRAGLVTFRGRVLTNMIRVLYNRASGGLSNDEWDLCLAFWYTYGVTMDMPCPDELPNPLAIQVNLLQEEQAHDEEM